jgi:beta-ureidopropionase / N-carbamoyl-L-amino-acid hydrolase
MITLETVNALSPEAFSEVLGAIFERSPWVAQSAAASRPFTSRLQLLDAMRAIVQSAPTEQQLALIRAHPQLGARGRKRLELTEASSREQRRAGLDACTDEEFEALMRLNAAYVHKFSFPFILAVRGHGPDSILESMGSRINNDTEFERHTALTQIGLIAGYRLADVVASPPGAEAVAMAERLAAAKDSDAGDDRSAAAGDRGGAANDRRASLLREWMLAANLEVYPGPDGNMLGVHAAPQAGQHLLVGAYSEPGTNALRRDGSLGSLLGIATAQQLRQQKMPTRFGLLVLASPADPRPGSIFLGTDLPPPRDWTTLNVADIESLVPLRAAGITDQCLAVVHEGAAPHAGNAAAIDRAARTLEHLLI